MLSIWLQSYYNFQMYASGSCQKYSFTDVMKMVYISLWYLTARSQKYSWRGFFYHIKCICHLKWQMNCYLQMAKNLWQIRETRVFLFGLLVTSRRLPLLEMAKIFAISNLVSNCKWKISCYWMAFISNLDVHKVIFSVKFWGISITKLL